MATTALVVPFHSNEALLRVCLSGLLQYTPNDVPIIVVQNSPDSVAPLHADAGGRVTVVQAGGVIGYSAAINLGAASTNADFIGLCDADTAYLGAWLDPHIEHLRHHPCTAVTASKLLDFRTGRIIDFGIGIGAGFHFHPFLDREPDCEETLAPMRVQAACSASMVVRMSCFRDIEGFDEAYRHYYQDVDFCLRIGARGHEVMVLPDAVVQHQGSSASLQRSPFRLEMNARHFARHWGGIEGDVPRYLGGQLDACRRSHGLMQDYALLNLSSLVEAETYLEVLKEHLRVHPMMSVAPQERDCSAIDLFAGVRDRPLSSDLPLLYLVDRFRALEPNALWLRWRRGRGDLVVDRHCNVLPADSLLPRRAAPVGEAGR